MFCLFQEIKNSDFNSPWRFMLPWACHHSDHSDEGFLRHPRTVVSEAGIAFLSLIRGVFEHLLGDLGRISYLSKDTLSAFLEACFAGVCTTFLNLFVQYAWECILLVTEYLGC
jgi:hypothetical protein